jgi:1-deoxy-D-xylulose-5-phosphate reductoisomerase
VSRPVVVLGATGSIGTQALEVIEDLGLEVTGLASRLPSPELASIAKRHPDARVVVTGGTGEERESFTALLGHRVSYGSEGLTELAATPGSTILNGVVGAAGLRASMAALEAGNRLALANKESLVAGGPVLKAALAEGHGELIPVDSEHSAIHQCLAGEPPGGIRRLLLTASGGPFRGRSADEMDAVTPAEALAHPTWVMGPRITIDSATLFNKGLEVIEAHHIFDVPFGDIEVVIHPQSVVHSAVEMSDGSWKAQLGHPDMRLPIQYALTFPERMASSAPRFEFAGATLEFEPVDRVNFPALDLSFAAGERGGSAPATLNAADEIAVEAFLQGRIGFTTIARLVEMTLEETAWRTVTTVEDVLEADRDARAVAGSLVARAC